MTASGSFFEWKLKIIEQTVFAFVLELRHLSWIMGETQHKNGSWL